MRENKVVSFHLNILGDNTYINASVVVPGIGEIKIHDCISLFLIEQIKTEILVSLDKKLGK